MEWENISTSLTSRASVFKFEEFLSQNDAVLKAVCDVDQFIAANNAMNNLHTMLVKAKKTGEKIPQTCSFMLNGLTVQVRLGKFGDQFGTGDIGRKRMGGLMMCAAMEIAKDETNYGALGSAVMPFSQKFGFGFTESEILALDPRFRPAAAMLKMMNKGWEHIVIYWPGLWRAIAVYLKENSLQIFGEVSEVVLAGLCGSLGASFPIQKGAVTGARFIPGTTWTEQRDDVKAAIRVEAEILLKNVLRDRIQHAGKSKVQAENYLNDLETPAVMPRSRFDGADDDDDLYSSGTGGATGGFGGMLSHTGGSGMKGMTGAKTAGTGFKNGK